MPAGRFQQGDDLCVRTGGQVVVDLFQRNRYAAPGLDCADELPQLFNEAALAFIFAVADIDREPYVAGDDVGSAGQHFRFPYGGDRIGTGGLDGQPFQLQGNFAACQESVMPQMHRGAARMALLAGQGHAKIGRSGDGVHDAYRQIQRFQHRALLDMQLDRSVHLAFRHGNFGEAGKIVSQFFQHLRERFAVLIGQRIGLLQRQFAGQGPAAQTAKPEARRFLRGIHDHFNAAFAGSAGGPDQPDGFQTGRNAGHPVEHACMNNGVNMGAGPNGRQLRLRSGERAENIADRVFPHGQAQSGHLLFDITPCFELRRCKQDTGRASRRVRIEGIQLLQHTADIGGRGGLRQHEAFAPFFGMITFCGL